MHVLYRPSIPAPTFATSLGSNDRVLMQNHLRRVSSRNDRVAFLDEEEEARSPSYFEWREQTVRTPALKVEPKPGALTRLFRRFTHKN